jgi:hypothetical protein
VRRNRVKQTPSIINRCKEIKSQSAGSLGLKSVGLFGKRFKSASEDNRRFEMAKRYTVVQIRVQPNGTTRYTVVGPGGEITVKVDTSGNLSGLTRSGYIGNQARAVARAIDAVRELREHRDLEGDQTTSEGISS